MDNNKKNLSRPTRNWKITIKLLLITYLVNVQVICQEIEQSLCSQGCVDCNQTENSQFVCSKCSNDYQLDIINNKCIYMKCDQNLFYQGFGNLSQKSECLAKCGDSYVEDIKTNLCNKQQDCSTYTISKNQLLLEKSITEVYKINDIILAIFKGYITQIRLETGIINKTINFSNDINLLRTIQNKIFILTNENIVYIWDTQFDSKQKIFMIKDKELFSPDIIQINEVIVCLVFTNQQQDQLYFHQIFNLKLTQTIESDKQFNFSYQNSKLYLKDHLIFIQSKFEVFAVQIQSKINGNKFILQYSDPLLILKQNEQITQLQIQQLLNLKNNDEYIVVFINSKIDLFYFSFQQNVSKQQNQQEIQQEIKKIKVISDKNKDIDLIVLLTQSNIIIQDKNLITIQTINQSEYQTTFTDIEIVQFDLQVQELYAISESNQLFIFYINEQQKLIFQQSQQLTMSKIQGFYPIQNYNEQQNVHNFGVLLQSVHDLQFFWKDSSTNLIKMTAIKNFKYSYPNPLGSFSNIVLIENESILATCVTNGYIQLFDISSGYKAELYKQINLNESCFQLYNAYSKQLISLLATKLQIIDYISGNITQEFNFLAELYGYPLISINGKYTLINLDGCFFLYDNTQFIEILKKCDPQITENNINIELSSNLSVVIQKQKQLLIIQIINSVDTPLQITKQINLDSNVVYFSAVKVMEGQQFDNQFYIDEIIIANEQKEIKLLDFELQIKYSLLIPELNIPNSIKRVIDDKDVYFLLQTQIIDQQAYYFFACIIIDQQQLKISSKLSSYLYSPFMSDPKKLTLPDGSIHYFFHQFFIFDQYFLGADCLTPQENIKSKKGALVYGQFYTLYGAGYSSHVISQDNRDGRHLMYFGSQKGLISGLDAIEQRYEIFDIKQYFIGIDDQIVSIVQSPFIGKYFIQLKSQILVFSIFDDKLLMKITFEKTPIKNSFEVLQDLDAIIYSDNLSIFIQYFKNEMEIKLFSFKQFQIISSWLYQKGENKILIYGSGFIILDMKFQVINDIVQTKQYIIKKCIKVINLCICQLDISAIIFIELKTISTKIQEIQGFSSSQFMMEVDQENNLICLIEQYIQVITFQGIIFQRIPLEGLIVNRFQFADQYIIIQSKTVIFVLSRKNYSTITNLYSPGGFNILKFEYISEYQQILFFCDNSVFSQLYLMDIKLQSIVGRITQPYPDNGIGNIIDFIYEKEISNIIYLDDKGNFCVNTLYNSYDLMGITLIYDVQIRNDIPQGFSLDLVSNNVYAYTKDTVYKLNYISHQDKAEIFYPEQSGQNVVIQLQQDKQQSQILVLGADNYIFRYQDYQLISEINFQETVISFRYIDSIKTLIVAFNDHFKIYNQYQYGDKSSLDSVKKTINFQFHKFIDDNVFLTYEKKLIHYDFQTNQIIKEIQLLNTIIITIIHVHMSKNVILIGYKNGDIQAYNKLSKKLFLISDIKQFQSYVYNKAIRFITDLQLDQVLIASSQGEIIEYNIFTNTLIKIYLVKDLLNQQMQIPQFINEFTIDQLTNRLYIMFYKSKVAYVWSLIEQKLVGLMISPNNQNNKIQFTQSYVLVRAASFVQLYKRQGDIQLISFIRGDYFLEIVTQIVELSKQIIAICYQDKFEVYYLLENHNQLIQRQRVNYPSILDYKYSKEAKGIFRILLLSENGIIELRINSEMYVINDNNQCAYLINSPFLNILEQQIFMIQPKMNEYFQFGRNIKPSNNQLVNLYIQTESDAIQYLNKVLISLQQIFTYKLVFSPISQDENKFLLYNTAFSEIQQEEWNLINYSLQISEECERQYHCEIGFDQKTQFIVWQNITISSLKNINRASINFFNLTSVTIFNLTITSNFNDELDDNTQQCLLCFQNVQKVYLYNVIIQNNQFSNNNLKLILIKDIKLLRIQNLQILNNVNPNIVMSLILIDKAEVRNTIITQNINEKTSDQHFMLEFNACNDTILSNLTFQSNKGYQMLNSSNTYQQFEYLITFSQDILKIQNLKMIENTGKISNQIIIQNSYIFLDQIQYSKNDGNCKFMNSKEVNIQNGLFDFNNGINGGAISIYRVQQKVLFEKVTIENNNAQGSGGGIYIEDIMTKDFQLDEVSVIQKNTALIGGGLRILNKQSELPLPKDYPFSSRIMNNKSKIYGDNSCTILQNIFIKNGNIKSMTDVHDQEVELSLYQLQFEKLLQNDKNMYYGHININSFKSGGNLMLNVYIQDDQMKNIDFSKEDILNLNYPNEIVDELKYISIQTDISGIKNLQLIGETILNYNMYDENLKIFQFKELSTYSSALQKKSFLIQLYLNKYAKENIKILVNINFRQCLTGEIQIEQQNNINVCQYCSLGTYSLVNPEVYSSPNNSSITQIDNQCKKCPDSALSCQGNQIKLKNGYWRKSNETDEIIECDKQLNSCLVEQPESSQDGCKEGFVGPICEECDVLGNEWSKNGTQRFVSSFYNKTCRLCSDIIYQFLFFIIQVIFMLAYFVSNSMKFIENFQYSIQCYYLRKMHFLPISKNSSASQSTTYIKIVLTYLQFSSILITQPSFLPLQLNILPNILGSSNKVITLSISCIISQSIYKKLGKAFVYGLVNFLTPILFMIICQVLLYSMSFNTIAKNTKKYIYSTLLFVTYMFFLVDIISFFTMMLTCRQIGSNSYHTIDLLSYCDDSQIKNLVFPFSASILAFWSLSPLGILYFLQKNKNSLELCTKKFVYGYFYHEMRVKYYYWEFIRIYLKIAVIISYTLLKSTHLMLARILVILFFAQYIKLVSDKKPFNQSMFTHTEVLSFQLLIVKIALLTFSESLTDISIIFEIIQYIIDYLNIFYLLSNAIKLTIINKNSLLSRVLIFIIKKLCSKNFYNNIEKNISSNFSTYVRWKKIKQNLKIIIQNQANLHIANNINAGTQQQFQTNLQIEENINSPTHNNSPSNYNQLLSMTNRTSQITSFNLLDKKKLQHEQQLQNSKNSLFKYVKSD